MRGDPRPRRPEIPRWSGAECPDCADPVEIVVLDDEGVRVRVNRKIDHRNPNIAARVVGNQLHGYRTMAGRPALGYQPFRLHAETCTEAPPPRFEQRPLFDNQEGTTTP